MAYFGKCLRFEMRDAVKTGNDNFRIITNITSTTQREIDKEKEIEQYLSEVEQRAITHVCPKNQLKARLANVLESLRSYELLSNIKDFEVVGNTIKIYFKSLVQLSEFETDLALSQVQSIYSSGEVNIENVEYLVENACQQVNGYNAVETKRTPIMPTLQQDMWGDICRKIIETCGVHVYNNWFSKLTPVINKGTRTIKLKAPNSFIQEEVTKRYGEVIKQVISSFGLGFKGIN